MGLSLGLGLGLGGLGLLWLRSKPSKRSRPAPDLSLQAPSAQQVWTSLTAVERTAVGVALARYEVGGEGGGLFLPYIIKNVKAAHSENESYISDIFILLRDDIKLLTSLDGG